MPNVSIEIPARLFASIYELYGESFMQPVERALDQLARGSNEPTPRAVPVIGSGTYPRPGTGTITGRVWEIADQVYESTGQANRMQVIERCQSEGININTANTQFSYWKKGLMGT